MIPCSYALGFWLGLLVDQIRLFSFRWKVFAKVLQKLGLIFDYACAIIGVTNLNFGSEVMLKLTELWL